MLTIIGGPMFAGKTTWLLDHVDGLPSDSFQLFKPTMDTRYAQDECVTHDGKRLSALNIDHKQPLFPEMPDYVKTILIDELNFFEPISLRKAIKQQEKLGRTVVGAGLLYDVKKNVFGATLPLAKKADRFIELFAICDGCGKPAPNTYSKIPPKGQVRLGGADTYGVCCDDCWEKMITAA